MPTTLSFQQHLDATEAAARTLAEQFGAAGPDAPVVSCPKWRARDLLVHQGIVHRWAAGHLRGRGDHQLDPAEVLAAVPDDQLGAWSRDSADELLAALRSADPDIEAMVFLNDAPRPREFWARRQAHETTIHAVDALSASLGRLPTASETDIDGALAVDGIDELLRGFFTRRSSRPDSGDRFSVHVTCSDREHSWTYRVDPPEVGVDQDPEAGAAFSGTAVQLYLGLWNRGNEITVSGDPSTLGRWRQTRQVRWS